MTGSPWPIPSPDRDTAEWWDATRRNELVVQQCVHCGSYQHYPRALCTTCAGTALRFVRSSGHGVVETFTVVHRAPHPAFAPPYVTALIRIEEGPVLMSNVVGCGADEVRIGLPVTVTWKSLPDGRRLPLFAPEGRSVWISR